MNRSYTQGIILFTALFIAFGCYFYQDFAFSLPYGLHDEAQADRLAVAMQYYDRGMNFFMPRTYHIYATDGITPVEFPIHSYLAALLGHIFGREHINTCFRLLTLTIGYFGLLSLYLTILKATKDIFSSLFIPFVLLCSPSFSYYLCTSMPDPAAVSLCFIGFYFFAEYFENHKYKKYAWAIVFLTLAALIKTSTGIALIAVVSYTVADLLFFKKLQLNNKLLKTGLLLLIPVILIAYNILYNQYLADKYHGYIFLMRVRPFDSWATMKFYFTYCLSVKFVNDYFTVAHYPLMLLVIVSGAIAMYFNKEKRRLFILPLMMVIGSLTLTILFGKQIEHHDYYFVSIWIPVIAITLTVLFIEIRKLIPAGRATMIFNPGLLCALFVIFFFGSRHYFKRINMDEQKYPGVTANNQAYWMQNGSEILDKLGIGKDSTIYVLDENAANVGLVYFDRRGMNAMKGSWEGTVFNIRSYMKDRDIRIMVCDARKMPEIKETYSRHFSEIFTELYIDDRCAVYYLDH